METMTYLDKPWLKSYKLGPYKLDQSYVPYPEVPVFKALDDAAEKYPGQTAILFEERELSYRDLKLQADRLAAALRKLGVGEGDRVCVFLPNCMEFVISDWGILKAGAAIVPTSTLRTDEGLAHEAGTSKSRVIICREEHLERVLVVKERLGIEHVIVTSRKGYDMEAINTSLPKGVHEFRKLLEDNDPKPPQTNINPREDLCELAFTGGATGTPKGVMITHYNRYSAIMQCLPWILKPLIRGIAGKSSVFLSIPLCHAYGHFIELTAAYLGLRILLMPDPRNIRAFVRAIQKHRPFLIPAVPTQLMRIAQAKIGKMNVIPMSGSAPLPVEVAEIIKKEIGTPVSEGYGLTETSTLTHLNVSAFSKVTGFMAKEKRGMGVPTPDTECRLVDQDTGEDIPAGSSGEIVVRGPQVMKGYWPEPGSGLTKDGWLHTGDIATMDEEGYFQLIDRTKDMVNVMGMKVYTVNVDEILYKHPAVLMAAAYGVPDSKRPGSENVMVSLQLKDEYKGTLTEKDIREFCRENLASYAVPKYVEFRESMPLTVTEKIFKKELRDEAIVKMKEKSNDKESDPEETE